MRIPDVFGKSKRKEDDVQQLIDLYQQHNENLKKMNVNLQLLYENFQVRFERIEKMINDLADTQKSETK